MVSRDREYEVKPGMTLLDSLKKINVLSESVIATRSGEMILDDEILKVDCSDFWRMTLPQSAQRL
jgi:sulfur carrier protein ThiS